MIPESEYIKIPYGDNDTLTVVSFDLVKKYHTEEDVERFGKWMYGQTCTVIPDTGKSGIYIHDYERWLRQGKMKEQCAHDWD